MQLIVHELYTDLDKLSRENEAFLRKEVETSVPGVTDVVFSYRLASYTDFLNRNALESRGITFRLVNGQLDSIISRPFAKFFNLNENPFTMDLDPSDIVAAAEKRDGSLLSTYLSADGHLALKTKFDFDNVQTQTGEKILAKNMKLLEEVDELVRQKLTVMFEFTSPSNRIVLPYQTSDLKVLAVRDNITGDYLYARDLADYPTVLANWVDEIEGIFTPDFLDHTYKAKGIEGYVLRFSNGKLVKIKTEWYQLLHKTKDSVGSDAQLFEAIVTEAIDDVKSMFPEDEYLQGRIREMEARIVPQFNHMAKTVEDFYNTNKDLDRKSYAIKGQKELSPYFSLGMNLYLGKPVDYKEFALKHRKDIFNVGDDLTTATNGATKEASDIDKGPTGIGEDYVRPDPIRVNG